MLVKFLATHGVVILAYWDIRHARNAWRAIQGALLQRLSLETAMRAFVSKEEVNKVRPSRPCASVHHTDSPPFLPYVQLIAGNSEGREFTAVNDGALMLRALNGEEGHLSALALQVTRASSTQHLALERRSRSDARSAPASKWLHLATFARYRRRRT